MKKLICLLLALCMLFSFAACKDTTKEPVDEPSSSTTEEPSQSETEEQPVVESPMTYFMLSYSDAEGAKYLTAYDNEDGTAHVEYAGAEKKIGELDAAVLENIAVELLKTDLTGMNGMEEYTEGEANASIYIQYADGNMIMANFGGVVPQEFMDGYAAMDTCFQTLTAELAVYVPELKIVGEVNPDGLAAMQEIMNGTGFSDLDDYSVSDVALDEFFGGTVGLSGSTGIANATLCSAMILTNPYSIVIVTVEDAASIDAVRADFAADIDWQKFVCVMPTDALIAQKGNMVLFFMGSDALFESTKTAIETSGWENVEGITNPDM